MCDDITEASDVPIREVDAPTHHESDEHSPADRTAAHLLDSIVAHDWRSSGMLSLERTNVDPDAFVSMAIRSTNVQVVPSSDGLYSTVRETGEANDFSRQSGHFDLHTDGMYCDRVPELVLLACANPGVGATTTIFVDTRIALDELARAGVTSTLSSLELVYVAKDGRHYPRPLVGLHPKFATSIVNIAARAFVRSKMDPTGRSPMVALRDVTEAVHLLMSALDRAIVHEQRWKEGDVVVFDNNRYCHGRQARALDRARTLYRIWLT